MLISSTGRSAVAIEPDKLRHAASMAVLEVAAKDMPDVAVRFTGVQGQFPQATQTRDCKQSLAILTDFIATIVEEDVFRGMTRYGAVLVDIDRFGVQRNNDAEREAVLRRFRAAGLTSIRPLLDLGVQGRYFLIASGSR
jgi:hypothetical protein